MTTWNKNWQYQKESKTWEGQLHSEGFYQKKPNLITKVGKKLKKILSPKGGTKS